MKGYDNIPEHEDILLDLPFYEADGAITRDQAKPHHEDVLLISAPTWETIASGLGVLAFDGTTNYIELDNAASVDLDFMADDYSIGIWLRWEDNNNNGIVIGRYLIDVSGWELYFWSGGGVIKYLTLRHHHAGTLVPPVTGNPRSACYSVGWVPDTWCFMGISRTGGGEAQHYRNAIPLTMVTGGLVDPETNNNDLVIGVRTSKDTHHYKGKMWRPRIWNRVLTTSEWINIFEQERDWFGV